MATSQHHSTDAISTLDVDQYVAEGIARNLQRVTEGSKEVFRSAWANDISPQDLLDTWNNIYESKVNILEPKLREVEETQRSKFGPRSIAIPWRERRASLEQYFRHSGVESDLNTKLKKIDNLRPLGLYAASKFLKSATSAGLPYLKKKGIVVDRVLASFDSLKDYPAMLYTRTQEQDKTRNIWGVPIKDTLSEMRYYQPLLERHKLLPWRKAIVSPDSVDRAVTELFRTMDSSTTLMSVDFSSYDASVSPQKQKEVFEYINTLFQPGCDADLSLIFKRFQTIGIVTPEGIWHGPHGVPSGSTFTNEVDSIAQYLSLPREMRESGLFQIQGDDGLYLTSNPDGLSDQFEEAGFQVNALKSVVSTDYCLFLQNYYSPRYQENGIYRRVYPIFRALNRIIFQERWSDFEDYGISGSDYYAIRTISILENCRYHPLFEEFVKFILSKDKYSLRYTKRGLAKYISRLAQTSGAVDVITNQLGDSLSGINEFATVRLVKTILKNDKGRTNVDES
jgi:hypothetical protein